MKSILQKLQKQIMLFIFDSILFFIILFITLCIRHLKIIDHVYFIDHVYSFFPIYLFFIISLFIADLYNVFDIINKSVKIKRIFISILSTMIFGVGYFYLFEDDFTPKTILVIHLGIMFILISIFRVYFSNKQFTKNRIKSMIISNSKEGLEIISEFSGCKYSIEIVLHISSIFIDGKSKEELRDIVKNYIMLHNIGLIILDSKDKSLNNLLENVFFDKEFENIQVVDMIDLYEYVFRKTPINSVGYNDLINNSEFSADKKIYFVIKRLVELLISVPVLIFWAILHPFVYYGLKKEIKNGEGQNVIFMNRNRIGKRGKVIKILKYRTMLYCDAGDKWPGQEDNINRITKFGEFLRRTRIDELPQILAVIKGDLSLVGPRQDEILLYDRLSHQIENYNFRYIVTPGLSGWAQTMMHIQPKSVEESLERFAYDMYYVKHQSIFLDIIIILRTIKTILSREG